MIDIGVARPSAHGQAMMSTATAFTRACARRGSGPAEAPHERRHHGDRDHGRHELARRPRRRAAGWARGCAAPRPPCGRSGRASVSRADALGAHHEAAGAVDGAAGDPAARRLLDRDRLAGHHRLVDGARALEHHAVDRHRLARAARAGGRPGCTSLERDVLLAAVRARSRRAVFGARPSSARMAPRRLRCARAARAPGRAARASVITAAASK